MDVTDRHAGLPSILLGDWLGRKKTFLQLGVVEHLEGRREYVNIQIGDLKEQTARILISLHGKSLTSIASNSPLEGVMEALTLLYGPFRLTGLTWVRVLGGPSCRSIMGDSKSTNRSRIHEAPPSKTPSGAAPAFPKAKYPGVWWPFGNKEFSD